MLFPSRVCSPISPPPPPASSKHSGILRLLQPQETEREGRPGAGRRTRWGYREGQQGYVPPPGGRRLSGLPLRRASQSRVMGSASPLSLLSWKPSLPTKHLGTTFLRGREGGVRGCRVGSRVSFLRARLQKAGSPAPGFYSRQSVSSCGWSPNWYVSL